jgi:coenzyme F420-dependent glucose-6-phosphate dehydrogenase
MVLCAYHAFHEQFTPSALLRYVGLAEQAGFTAVSSSDHFQPWSPRQGQSGFAWAWLGAAMQVTSLPFSMVCAPGQRYHLMIIAQVAATLAELFPGRFRLALGSGEALNERVIDEPWPPKPERNARLLECIDIMRALWAGQTVTHYGRVRVAEGRLYTRPAVPPWIFGAAVTAETARWVSRWADGLLTEGGALEIVRRLIVPRWPSLSDSNPKPTLLQIGLWVLDNDHGPIGGWSGRRRMAALLVSLITTATLGTPRHGEGSLGQLPAGRPRYCQAAQDRDEEGHHYHLIMYSIGMS